MIEAVREIEAAIALGRHRRWVRASIFVALVIDRNALDVAEHLREIARQRDATEFPTPRPFAVARRADRFGRLIENDGWGPDPSDERPWAGASYPAPLRATAARER